MEKSIIRFAILFFCLVCAVAPSLAASPLPVSPGSSQAITVVEQCCPTFSWAAVDNAAGYELTVFALGDAYEFQGEALYDELIQAYSPVLVVNIPAPALSWTPSAIQRLEPEKNYAWCIRSVQPESDSEWSDAAFFATAVDSLLEEKISNVLQALIADDGNLLTYSATSERTTDYQGGSTTRNTVYGYLAGADVVGSTSSTDNTFLGYYSGYATAATNSTHNSFFGSYSGAYNEYGDYNSFFGYAAGYLGHNTSGNSFFGYNTGYENDTGCYNSLFGYCAGRGNETGSSNSFFGSNSGYKNTGGGYNTFIGCDSGHQNISGSQNVFIGYGAGYYELGSYKLYIDSSLTNDPLIYGDFLANTLKVNGTLEFTAAYATSDRRWKKDIEPLTDSLAGLWQLEGKSYFWRRDEFPDKGFPEGRQFGLIAQEVEKIFPELVQTDAAGYKSVAYTQAVPLLIEAVKAQRHQLEKQNQTIELLLRRVEALERK